MKTTIGLFSAAFVTLLGIAAFTTVAKEFDPVKIDGGLVSGTFNAAGDIRIFRGIPFAAPPVGNLRWKAPQPVKPWTGVRKCDAFGPSPMQGTPSPFGPWSAEYLIAKEPISEDCLYLNVWTGAKSATEKRPQERLPVLLWIYGGGFGSGGGNVPIYDGEATAQKGVILVSANYRVGPFGFFAHPELTKESGQNASGNYGLMDQIAALRWVKQNIAQFGGDPNNVTIAGQSAGSMSVNCLVASPLAKNLFTKAIAESGASLARPMSTLAQAEESGMKVMQTMGTSSLAELRAKSAAEILQKGQGSVRGPIVDGYVIPQPMAELFRAGHQNKVTLLTGWNEDEGMSFSPPKNAVDYKRQIRQQYGADGETMLVHYPGETDAQAATSQNNLSRDQIFGAQNYGWANLESGQGKKVYVYRFTRKLPATGEYARYGAFHTGEVAYAYDNLKFIDKQLRPLNATDDELARTMSTYWVNFIKTGNPDGKGVPHWPAYSVSDKQIMMLGDKVQAQTLTDAASLDFLFGLMSRK
ncbi:carboxylesterase/lipase family protein [Fibrella forsythiae]|uniref:Carboxylic ester hydrolase n=1 Tax=Fibrella forsythiae TaxID=2817061 RepID=A0ABS3JG42_9BACT|nr:carboxylesterase family protein [Fibrella forsythiae]MBO0948970.1 carboxylesterase family protein [Fibrella forsythiae]